MGTGIVWTITGPLLQCFDMTDWRQIQARIRKAKNSPDALAKLSELFQRTHDGMVAWELGTIEEKASRASEAAKWYSVAAERFRRAEWKKKAEEALIRLGVPLPATVEPAAENDQGQEPLQQAAKDEVAYERADEAMLPAPRVEEHAVASGGSESPVTAGNANLGDPRKRKRRRGRRGGRGRRSNPAAARPSLPTQVFAESVESQSHRPERKPVSAAQPEGRTTGLERTEVAERRAEETARPVLVETPPPQLPSERTAHGRAGEPGLASRMAQLESMLRRLLSSPLHRVEEADQAPAGPGVFLLSDTDQTSSYYIEACQTLRVGLGNLVRGSRGGKGNRGGRGYSESGGLKEKLAEHLGIDESKVSQYLKEHCVVRWIQLDDDAPHLAHFAIGVLRTPLNID